MAKQQAKNPSLKPGATRQSVQFDAEMADLLGKMTEMHGLTNVDLVRRLLRYAMSLHSYERMAILDILPEQLKTPDIAEMVFKKLIYGGLRQAKDQIQDQIEVENGITYIQPPSGKRQYLRHATPEDLERTGQMSLDELLGGDRPRPTEDQVEEARKKKRAGKPITGRTPPPKRKKR